MRTTYRHLYSHNLSQRNVVLLVVSVVVGLDERGQCRRSFPPGSPKSFSRWGWVKVVRAGGLVLIVCCFFRGLSGGHHGGEGYGMVLVIAGGRAGVVLAGIRGLVAGSGSLSRWSCRGRLRSRGGRGELYRHHRRAGAAGGRPRTNRVHDVMWEGVVCKAYLAESENT